MAKTLGKSTCFFRQRLCSSAHATSQMTTATVVLPLSGPTGS
jgi:hypothetical protein